MKLLSNYSKHKLLESVPDFFQEDKILQWILEGKDRIENFCIRQDTEFLSLDWSEIAQEQKNLLGFYPLKNWRKFVLSVYFADIVSYPLVDQVSFERLLFVMHTFPQGFKTWWIKISHEVWLPAGYSAWYPMLETTFELFEKYPEKLKDRMVVPHFSLSNLKPYLYLFNFSVAPIFKSTEMTKLLIKKLVQDVHAQNYAGLACITVSDDGKRIANRFGMSHKGDLNLNGRLEGVYTKSGL